MRRTKCFYKNCTIAVVYSGVITKEEGGSKAADQWDSLHKNNHPNAWKISNVIKHRKDINSPTSVSRYSCGCICHILAIWLPVKRYRHKARCPKHVHHWLWVIVVMQNSQRKEKDMTGRPHRLWIQWSQTVFGVPLLLFVGHYTAESC